MRSSEIVLLIYIHIYSELDKRNNALLVNFIVRDSKMLTIC